MPIGASAQETESGNDTEYGTTSDAEGAAVEVSTETELIAALANGGNIMLTGDITVSDEYWGGYEITKNTTIDLNGHTITGVHVFTPNPENAGVVLTISGNGTIKATDPDNDMPVDVWGTLNLLGGTIEGYTNIFGTINMSGGWVDQLNTDKLNSDDDTSHITGGYVRHLNCWGGIVTISGGHVEALGIKYGTIIISGGTFGFDPTAYLAEGYTATEADGKWVVTCANGCEYTYSDNGDGTHTATCSVCGHKVTEEHSTEKDENKANCQHGNICDICGVEYSNPDPDNHNYHGSICIDCGHFDADAAEVGTATIDGTLGGKATATEDDITALVEQLKAYVDSGITTIIVTGETPATIEVEGYTIPAIGEAIYRMRNDDSYNGKIDLILQDVTEIAVQGFYYAYALNSITLPKVKTVGDEAFQGCDYMKQITFGSVVTSIVQKNGLTFHVGDKVDGCDLVLNCGQMHTEDTYKPDLENNVWFKPSWGGDVTWKSITLTHGKATPGSYENIGPEGHNYFCSVCYTTVTEAHSGEGTCTHPAECEHCWAEFGDIDPDNHNYHGSICIDCGHFDADAAEVEIYDGYYSRVIIDDDYDVEKLTYYRELPNQEWNSLYVPFEIEVTDELLEDYEVAYMNNMHTYDADDDGSFDKMDMEIIKIKNGTLKANYPYFIRAKNTEAMDMNLVIENALVESTVGRTVSCQSVRSIFELRGIYERMRQADFAEMHGTHYAISTEGGWWRTEGLNPFRAYLTIIPRSGTPVNAPAVRSIGITVGGEENTTGVTEVKTEPTVDANQNGEWKTEIYDLQGRRINEITESGIYIVDGKKVIVK